MSGETVQSCPARDFTHYHYLCWQCSALVCSKYSNSYTCELCDCAGGSGSVGSPANRMADFNPEFAATAHSPDTGFCP